MRTVHCIGVTPCLAHHPQSFASSVCLYLPGTCYDDIYLSTICQLFFCSFLFFYLSELKGFVRIL